MKTDIAGITAEAFCAMFPPGVNVDARVIHPSYVHELLPDEAILAAGFAPARLAEFATGRASLRFVIERLTGRVTPVEIGQRREPILPNGVVGSITHSAGVVAAAVAPAAVFAGIGLDMEVASRVSVELLPSLISAREARAKPAGLECSVWLAMHFAGKEAVFKAIHPIIRRYIDFHDIELSFSGNNFVATPRPGEESLRRLRINGQVHLVSSWILAAAWLDASFRAQRED
ncbi:4'-phosphopantetheinyl transferase family protein [Rhizobium laguerreae]|uniref:4'-phosphopantetheinyl transferase family protein n=1 Tax=Rhizobium laguerreae TaxID=1076926 RepID=UPI001C90C336|nr:4'-phosphopantetheinyl transferase superfamily protein [Rhizobium laguerreae]MBY3252516.1 4'-phosphopantetheinyl transferase superfamily protein [Rhizobium laguerreae]